MSRPIFTQSFETKKIVAMFREMSLGESMSFAEASKRAGFKISSTLPSYQRAKYVCERDHGVVVSAIKGFGFVRIDGSSMVKRAPAFMKRVRKGAKREARVQEIAISTNLTRAEMMVATEQLSRLRLLETTAVSVSPVSNKPERHEPEAIRPR